MRPLLLALSLLAACAGDDDSAASGPPVEPLDLPEDPAAMGAPVGVRTVEHEGLTLEVWYPATNATAGQPGDRIEGMDFIPDAFASLIGLEDAGGWETAAVRDATPRTLEERLPVVVISHGFAAFRTIHADLSVHLASRGYVVVAADHDGRTLGDLLPCLVSLTDPDCSLQAVPDPAIDDIALALDWVDGPAGNTDLAPLLDTERLALVGHSAGGNSAAQVGSTEDRFSVLVPISANAAVTRDVPAVFVAGTCDGFVSAESSAEAAAESPDATLVLLPGAGHQAFTDLCRVDLAGLTEDYLVGNPNISQSLAEQFLPLGIDGCPGAPPLVDTPECAAGFLDLEEGLSATRHVVTVALDDVLKGEGAGVAGLTLEAVRVE